MRTLFSCLSLAVSLIVSPASQADVFTYKPLEFAVGAELKLKITGFRGKVSFKGVEKTENVRILVKKILSGRPHDEAWNLHVENTEKQVSLQIKGPEERTVWLAGHRAPEFEIVVVGKALPTEVYWRNGLVRDTNWNSSLKAVMMEGEYRSSKSQGQRDLALRQGRVELEQFEGPFSGDFYNVDFLEKNSEGITKIDNFSGSSQVIAHRGAVHLESYNGKVQLNEVEGSVDFLVQRGEVNAKDYEGDLKGVANDSSVNIDYKGKSHLNISSTTGAIRVTSGKGSGAKVNVASTEGALYVPSHIKVTRTAARKIAVGKMNGHLSGQVYVRTSSGNIVVR